MKKNYSLLHRSILTFGAASLTLLSSAVVASAALTPPRVGHALAPSSSGTVIAVNTVRHTIVVANGGVVHTWRLAASPTVKVGTNVSATTALLGDGTYNATGLKATGSAKSVHLNATVVATVKKSLVLSANASTFSVAIATAKSPKSSGGATSPTATGSVDALDATISGGQLSETNASTSGSTSLITLEGVVSALSATSLTVTVDNGAATTVVVPASITLPSTLANGSWVQVLVSFDGTTFTLVTVASDSVAASQATNGVSQDNNGQSATIEVEGQVVAADASTLTVQPGNGAAATIISIPSGLVVPAITIGNFVHAQAAMVNGVLTLVSVRVHAAQNAQGNSQTEASGVVVAVSATSLTIQPGDNATAVTFVVPSTIDVSSINVGDRVRANGSLASGTLTLTSFNDRGPAQNGQNQGAGISSEVDGIVTASSSTSISIQPGDGAPLTVVAVPAGVDVSSVAVGNYIHASVTLISGTLTLVSYNTGQTGGDGQHQGQGGASGVITAVSATQLVLNAGEHGNAITIAVPSTIDVSSLTVGQRIHVVTTQVAGVLTLVSFSTAYSQSGHNGGGDGGQNGQGGQGGGPQVIDASGAITLVSASQLILSTHENATYTIVVPSTIDVSSLSVGQYVHVTASVNAGVLTLVSVNVITHQNGNNDR